MMTQEFRKEKDPVYATIRSSRGLVTSFLASNRAEENVTKNYDVNAAKKYLKKHEDQTEIAYVMFRNNQRCGICCKNIDKIPELSKFHTGDGVCVYLSNDNLCKIYSNRPDICNVDRMYHKTYKEIMSIEEYERMNMEGCKFLQNMKK